MDPLLARFSHPYYLLKLLACFPALFHWLMLAIPAGSLSTHQINFLQSSQLTLTIPLIAVPVLVHLRLTRLRKSFNLPSLSPETVLDTWLVHFVAFNLASLALLGGWIPATTYLTCLVSFGLLCPKPPYLGPSKIRTLVPEAFTKEVMNRTSSSVMGFSAGELLNLTPETLKTQLDSPKQSSSKSFPANKKWVIWPISESRKRAHVGLMDMEIILANLSLEFGDHSDELEFIILDMENSNSLCYTLKIWAEDDSASSPIQPSVDDLVLLQYQAGREINRLPARQLCNGDSSDDEDAPVHDSHSSTPILWSQETIITAFNLKSNLKSA